MNIVIGKTYDVVTVGGGKKAYTFIPRAIDGEGRYYGECININRGPINYAAVDALGNFPGNNRRIVPHTVKRTKYVGLFKRVADGLIAADQPRDTREEIQPTPGWALLSVAEHTWEEEE